MFQGQGDTGPGRVLMVRQPPWGVSAKEAPENLPEPPSALPEAGSGHVCSSLAAGIVPGRLLSRVCGLGGGGSRKSQVFCTARGTPRIDSLLGPVSPSGKGDNDPCAYVTGRVLYRWEPGQGPLCVPPPPGLSFPGAWQDPPQIGRAHV